MRTSSRTSCISRRAGNSRSTADYLRHDRYGQIRPFTRKFLDMFGPPRRRDEPITDRHRDLAFALQATTEETVLHVVRALAASHPSRNLCLTGGVALNCVANARILRDTDYRRVWVPPCASDTGAPLGQRAVAPASDARAPAHLRADASLLRHDLWR